MSLFQKKYRIESTRLPSWDYGCDALYFITICTRNSEHFFGKIVDGEMGLSGLGIMAERCWNRIPQHFPFVILDVWTIMPNHIHGIIKISKNEALVETQDFASPANTDHIARDHASKNHFGPQSRNLASVIRGFKIGVTKWASENEISFGWQPRFHDHVIRDQESYFKIRNYILSNVKNWSRDIFYTP